MPFVKGQSGNPGGRLSLPDELKADLRKEGRKVFDFWVKSYQDDTLRWDYRDRAGRNIVEYAYGKPRESVDVDHSGKIEGIQITIIDPKNES
jgi:hypothetical protein